MARGRGRGRGCCENMQPLGYSGSVRWSWVPLSDLLFLDPACLFLLEMLRVSLSLNSAAGAPLLCCYSLQRQGLCRHLPSCITQ